MNQIYVDHHLLTSLAGTSPEKYEESEEYLNFLAEVRKQVLALEDIHQQVIIMYYFECLDIEKIASEISLHEDDIRKLIREGLLKLEHSLSPLIQKRWPERFKKIKRCRICGHPKQKQIEKILKAKKPSESWGKINRLIKKQLGCSFNPPSLMISHMKYHMTDKKQILQDENE